jgi:hypothetical protein
MNHLGDFDTGSRTDAGHRHDGTGFGVVGLEAGRGKKRVERIKRERKETQPTDVSGKLRGPALCGHDGNRLGQKFGVGVAVLNRFMVWGEVPVRRRDDWEVEMTMGFGTAMTGRSG